MVVYRQRVITAGTKIIDIGEVPGEVTGGGQFAGQRRHQMTMGLQHLATEIRQLVTIQLDGGEGDVVGAGVLDGQLLLGDLPAQRLRRLRDARRQTVRTVEELDPGSDGKLQIVVALALFWLWRDLQRVKPEQRLPVLWQQGRRMIILCTS